MIGSGKTRPDLAIEVIWTHGGLDKLEAYRGLQVQEVWMWARGRITVRCLRGEHYVEVAASELLPELDLELLTSHIDPEHQLASVRGYRQALRERR
jgi:Uma2 family endonuclease